MIRASVGASALLVPALALFAACSSSDPEPAPATPGSVADGGDEGGTASGDAVTSIRIGQFNLWEMSTDKLLDQGNAQLTAAGKIVARKLPDIALFNEIQYDIAGYPDRGSPGATADKEGGFDDGARNANRLAGFIERANGSIPYTDSLITRSNSGFPWKGDDLGNDWYALRGWGEFPGRFNTVVLSRWPIKKAEVRVITDFAWKDLPGNSLSRAKSEKNIEIPDGYPLFEKSLNIVPVDVKGETLYLVLLHPTAPAFWDVNVYRNYDEILALKLFLDGKLPGVDPLPAGAKFVVVGDLNADYDNDGDGLDGAVKLIADHPSVVKWFPTGAGSGGSNRGQNGQYNTYSSGCGKGEIVADPSVKFQLQLDYILPSKTLGAPTAGEVFFPEPTKSRDDWNLACAASDHRFLWADLPWGK